MKKTLIAATLLALAGSALALDVGVVGGYESNLDNRGFVGATVGQQFGKVGVTAGFERSTVRADAQNRVNLTASYDVLKVNSLTLVGKGGVVFLDNTNAPDGWAAQVGAGVVVPLTGKWAATVDYRYQVGQARVNKFDGGAFLAGVKYSF